MPQPAVVLDHDRALLDLIPSRELSDARAASLARLIEVPAGPWNVARKADAARGGFGLLCIRGLLLRQVGLSGCYGAEALGVGDILRPWQHDGEEIGFLHPDTTWRVFSPARFAVLDIRWAMRMARWPAIGCELVGRALARSLRLATLIAISQHRQLDVRLRLVLWTLADRYGVVRPDGVHVLVPLTHEALAHLAVARRPSVSTALGRLAERGELRREGRRFILLGEPPDASELDQPELRGQVPSSARRQPAR